MQMVRTIFFFWILWCPNNGKSGSWISLIFWTLFLKKCTTLTHHNSVKDPNHSFSILCSYIEMVVNGTSAWYIFFNSLMLNLWKMLVTDIINMLGIVLKKFRTWALMHSCKGLNHSFFNFVILFWGGCAWKWCMIYFFLNSLMFNLWKTFVTNIINFLDIVLKKCRTWVLA